MTPHDELAEKVRDLAGGQVNTLSAQITDMTNFRSLGYVLAILGSSTVKVVARTLDCLQVGDWIFVRKMRAERWSDYVYDHFGYRDLPGGTRLYQPTFCPPATVIVAWSGTVAMIPEGWLLCDGTRGTPNLSERFVKIANNDAGVLTGWTKFYPINNSHAHPGALPDADTEHDHGDPHILTIYQDGGGGKSPAGHATEIGSTHLHYGVANDIANHGHVHPCIGLTSYSNIIYEELPPYYALCYIKSQEPVYLPPGVSAWFDGFASQIPNGYGPIAVTGMAIGAGVYPLGYTSGGYDDEKLWPIPYHYHSLSGVAATPSFHGHTHASPGTTPLIPDGMPFLPAGVGDGGILAHAHPFMLDTGAFEGNHGHGFTEGQETEQDQSLRVPTDEAGNPLPQTYSITPNYLGLYAISFGGNSNGEAGLPIGAIAMLLDRARLPDGWLVCDGSNGTPNLTDRLILGKGPRHPLFTAGGSRFWQVPNHTHNTATGVPSQTNDEFILHGDDEFTVTTTTGFWFPDGRHHHTWRPAIQESSSGEFDATELGPGLAIPVEYLHADNEADFTDNDLIIIAYDPEHLNPYAGPPYYSVGSIVFTIAKESRHTHDCTGRTQGPSLIHHSFPVTDNTTDIMPAVGSVLFVIRVS